MLQKKLRPFAAPEEAACKWLGHIALWGMLQIFFSRKEVERGIKRVIPLVLRIVFLKQLWTIIVFNDSP